MVRKDGVRRLDALYGMQAEDGEIVRVRNRVLIDDPTGGPRHAFSTLEITAPKGLHARLNRAVSAGTLNDLRPGREAVLVRVFKLVQPDPDVPTGERGSQRPKSWYSGFGIMSTACATRLV